MEFDKTTEGRAALIQKSFAPGSIQPHRIALRYDGYMRAPRTLYVEYFRSGRCGCMPVRSNHFGVPHENTFQEGSDTSSRPVGFDGTMLKIQESVTDCQTISNAAKARLSVRALKLETYGQCGCSTSTDGAKTTLFCRP